MAKGKSFTKSTGGTGKAAVKNYRRGDHKGPNKRDITIIAVFGGLVVLGIIAIAIAGFTSLGTPATNPANDTAADTSTSEDSGTTDTSATEDDSTAETVTPPPLNLLAEPDGNLQKIDITPGSGDEAGIGDTVEVNYTGYLEDGTVFDSSLFRGQPYPVTLGAGQVIEGWEQGLLGMKPGGTRQLIIPPSMAYGDEDYSSIPGGSTLIFDVELVSIK
jgi:FKBP-type peptidyl-prolyl cis-trans isomerase